MRVLKRLFDFYIESSLHIGFAVMSLVFVTIYSYDLCKSFVYPSSIFFGTIVAYNFLKYFELIVFKKTSTPKMFAIIRVTLISFLAFLFLFFMLKRNIQIQIVLTGLLVLVYPLLRNKGLIKLFLVSFVVAIVTVYIPYQSDKIEWFDYKFNLIQRFLFITILMIPFEIYDSQFDKDTLNTIPQRFGIRNSKWFGVLLIIPFIALEFLKEKISFVAIPIGLITVLAIYYTTLNRNKYYTSFWVESIPIVWLVLVFFTKIFF